MAPETITLLVKFLPTILSALIILLCMLRGLIRGFRKSLILFLHYIISITLGLIAYFALTNFLMNSDLNSIVSNIGPEFSEAHGILDVANVLIKQYIPEYSGIFANQYMGQITIAICGLAVSLACGIVCLVVLPLLIRLILRILYLLFYREGKYKKHIEAEGGEYHANRFFGMLVGAARGLVCSLLLVSYITSIYFIGSGGITKSEENVNDVQVLTYLSDTYSFDFNAVYKGLKESRSTGIGALFDLIQIEGKPIDLYYTDLYLTSTFNTIGKKQDELGRFNSYLSSDEEYQAAVAELCVRKELSLVVSLVEEMLEANIITIENGQVVVNYDKMNDEINLRAQEYVENSVILNDITPLALLGICEAINEGHLSLGEDFDKYFTDENIETLKRIDIEKDMEKLVLVCISASELLPLDANGNIDLLALEDIETYLNFDVDKVVEIFEDLSNIETLTDLVLPISIGISVDFMRADITDAGINIDEFNLEEIEWDKEIRNIGQIYKAFVALDLDIDKLMDTEVNEETGMSGQIEYMLDLISNEETTPVFKQNLLNLVDTIFSDDTKLFGQVALVASKSLLAQVEFVSEDGSETAIGNAFEDLKGNLNYYTQADLKEDLHTIITSGIDAAKLIPLFTSASNIDPENPTTIFSTLYEIDTDSLRKALLGEYDSENDVYIGGIYNIKLLNGDLNDPNALNVTDDLIVGLLKAFASDYISSETVDSITDWRMELDSLVTVIEELQTIPNLDQIKIENLQSNIFDVLPSTLTLDDIDTLTEAISKSKLLSSIIESTISDTLNNNKELLGDITIRDDIVWTDTFYIDGTVKKHGELNALLKSLTIFSDDKKNIDLNNNDSLLNGLGLLIHEASEEELTDPNKASDLYTYEGITLDYEEVLAISKSEILMTILSQKISGLANEDGGLPIFIPDRLDTTKNPNNWVYWAYDNESNYNYKQGEFAKLALVLYFARNYAELNYSDEPLTVSDTLEEETEYYLTVDNLLNSLIYMDKDEVITSSVVLYGTVSKMLMDMQGDVNSLIMVPTEAQQDPASNEGIAVLKEEVEKLFAVCRILEVDLYGNEFGELSMGIIIEKSDNPDVRKELCFSKIFAMTAVNRLTQIAEITIPYEYLRDDGYGNVSHPVWYPTSYNDDSWTTCELNNMLASLKLIGIEADPNDKNNLIVPEDLDEILENLNKDLTNGQKAIDIVYESRVFRTMVSDLILHDESGLLLVRGDALIAEDFMVSKTSNDNIKLSELKGLIDYLQTNDISIYDEEKGAVDIKLQPIINSLKKLEVREYISNSNILSSTIINQLGSVDGFLVIPDKFKSDDNFDPRLEAWYPESSDTWQDSEIAHLLATIVELGLEADSNNELTEPSIQEILDSLGREHALTNSNEDSLTVAYRSLVIKETLKSKISTANEMLLVTEDAYDNEGYVKDEEVESIIKLSKSVTDIESVNLEEILVMVKASKENRELFSNSIILSQTLVDQVSSSDELDIPSIYKDDLGIAKAAYDKDWYVKDSDGRNEVSNLLDAIVELDIKADGNTLTQTDTQVLLTNLGREKALTNELEDSLTVAYRSLVIKETLKSKLNTANEMILVTEDAYDNDGYVKDEEVESIITLAGKVNINNVTLEEILTLIKASKENRELFTDSIILSRTFVDQIAHSGEFSVPSKYTDELNGKTSAAYDKDWYVVENNSSEVSRLMDAVVELDVKANDNTIDTDSVKPTVILNNLHNASKTDSSSEQALDVTYRSDIVKETLTDKLAGIGKVKARNEAYEKDQYGNPTKYYDVEELRILIEFIYVSEINIDGGADLDAEHIFKLLQSSEQYNETESKADAFVRIISTSNILNKTMVDIIGGEGIPSPNANILFAEWYLNSDGTVNKDFEDWYPKFESSTDYKESEIYHLLVAIEELELKARENTITTSTDEMIEKLNKSSVTQENQSKLKVVYESDHIAKTISVRLSKFVGNDLPSIDASGNSIYDTTGHRSNDVIISYKEIDALLHAVEVLGLSFFDEDDTSAVLTAGSLTSLSAAELHDNFTDVIASAIIHKYISQTLIDQTQDVNGEEYGIVTRTYWADSSTSKFVIMPELSEVYVDPTEIDNALIALIKLGITIDNVGSIDSSYLEQHFGSGVKEDVRAELIECVKKSSILSKIFSEIVTSDTFIFSKIQTITGPLTTKPVYEVKTKVDRNVLTQVDLAKVLDAYAIVSSMV